MDKLDSRCAQVFLGKLSAHISSLFLVLPILVFSLSVVNTWHVDLGWHDQQRIYQLFLLTVAAALLIFLDQVYFPAGALTTLTIVFFLGFLSSLLSNWPLWAFKEWGRYIGLLILTLLVTASVQRRWFVASVLGLIAFVGFLHAFQFTVFYAVAFLSGIYMLDANLLFNGFSNPRFFGQFQILLMPVLAGLALMLRQKKPRISAVLFVALAVQWCIAMTLGGRGLWLGPAVSGLMLLLAARRYWPLLAVQVCAGLVGAVLFIILFYLIPGWLDIAPNIRDSLRTSLSGREHIWLSAWEMAKANPWLGVGPMHYSATYNSIAAHPHQVVLQWAAEWGIPATLLAMGLAAWGMLFGLSRLRQGEVDHISAALWLSIAGALVLAQVDGVFVMPYTETWLAILIGLAIARWATPHPAPPVQRIFFRILAIPVILIMGDVLINEVPTLAEDSEAHMTKHRTGRTPRFWLQGWIPMDGVDGRGEVGAE